MSAATAVSEKVRNGVKTQQLHATLDLIKAQPAPATFQLRATEPLH